MNESSHAIEAGPQLAAAIPPDPAAAADISYRSGYRDASVDQLADVIRHMDRYATAPDPLATLRRWVAARLDTASRERPSWE